VLGMQYEILHRNGCLGDHSLSAVFCLFDGLVAAIQLL
jgi:hypothetical protein